MEGNYNLSSYLTYYVQKNKISYTTECLSLLLSTLLA